MTINEDELAKAWSDEIILLMIVNLYMMLLYSCPLKNPGLTISDLR